MPTTSQLICSFSISPLKTTTKNQKDLSRMICLKSCKMDILLKILPCSIKMMSPMISVKTYPAVGVTNLHTTTQICLPPVAKITMSLPGTPPSHLSPTKTTSSTSRPTSPSSATTSTTEKSRKITSKNRYTKNIPIIIIITKPTAKTKWTSKTRPSNPNLPSIPTIVTPYPRVITLSALLPKLTPP